MRTFAAGAPRAASLLGVATVLWHAGRHGLPSPPVHRPGDLGPWVTELGPTGAAMAIIRVTAMTVAATLGAATVLAVVAGARGAGRRLEPLLDRLPGPAARLLKGLAGASVTAGVSVMAASATLGGDPGAPRPPPVDATMHHRLAGSIAAPVDGAAPQVTRHRLLRGPVEWMEAAPEPAEARLRALPDETDPATARLRSLDDVEAWTVAPGESFWSIAVDHLADLWGRPPSVAEVTPYWADLVELNRARLVTGDPDLIYPGQELLLAPVH